MAQVEGLLSMIMLLLQSDMYISLSTHFENKIACEDGDFQLNVCSHKSIYSL